ncbi:MAG: 50S ribosomal protein L24e [Euryarchaeota archaeon]|jgi:large subunit ribosomal protein L24e|nr:50S ribosomal protein L24e [Euryarchaeota archaeon]|tara:strand:+ start:67 stop:258 length:192 start_codon:yes stop_codon:yes gene_type:complete
MPERRICSFSHEEIEPGTGMMFVRRDGTVMWFKDSKARKNSLKLKRNPRRMKWTQRYEKGGIK